MAARDNLVFDFPEASPRFEFSENNPKFEFSSKMKMKKMLPSRNKGSMASPAITKNHSNAHASTSSNMSEVSEFSFDRVTVTTAGTQGMSSDASSNVSWNFFELGENHKVVPFDDDFPHSNNHSNRHNNHSNRHNNHSNSQANNQASAQSNNQPLTSQRHRQPTTQQLQQSRALSLDAFDDVSLESSAIPLNGVISDNVSAISDSSDRKQSQNPATPKRSTIEELKQTYYNYKKQRSKDTNAVKSIVDDIYFCTWVVCGRDTTLDSRTKEERKKEADDTFLGKVVTCRILDDAACGGCTAL